MRKKTKVLVWTGAVVVVLGTGGIATTNFLLNKFLDSMSEQVVATAVGKSGETDASSEASADEGSKEKQADGNVQKAAQETVSSEEEAPAAKKEAAKDPKGYTANLTGEKIKEIKEDVSVSDKMDVMAILLKKLSLSDIRKLQQLAQGGLTREKKREARAIIHDKVTPEQYDELITIAKKYGVSQGRNYEEVIKQEERLLKQEKSK
ncbi:hypothetical protein [Paenibacillus humicus]|uniref:hypothetical protein n=1 Tax=Paenibacillus humicus TaxID=412861 RepID=UPI000FDC97A1|nr:hypothetical protein [Paenibacillus humicus]